MSGLKAELPPLQATPDAPAAPEELASLGNSAGATERLADVVNLARSGGPNAVITAITGQLKK